MGLIADIAYQRGDYEEALRIRREVQLPADERLGATREAAITWSNIADIGCQRGDYEKTAGLQRKRLEANKQLGDLDGIAAADQDRPRERTTSQPSPGPMESFQISSRLQRPDGIATVGWILG